MIRLKSCPNCGSVRIGVYKLIGADPHVMHEIMPKVFVEAAIITRYFVCFNCNLIFQNPRLSDSQLDKFYSLGFYRRIINSTPEVAYKNEENRAKTDAKIIKEHLGIIKTHLDIGSSRGYLLEAIAAEVKVGVESNLDSHKMKDIKIYSKISEVPQKSFDLITAIHVLEHIPRPLVYLKKVTKFMAKNSHLVIEVPTWKSFGGPLRLPHLSHFEPSVLRHMCAQSDLKITHEEFTPHLRLICKKA
jgi:hypothetical protein